MPQGYITKIDEKADTGWIRVQGWTGEFMFRHWGIAPENGGVWPKVGDYVQFRVITGDVRYGTYLSDVRVLSKPEQQGPTTKTLASQQAGIMRVEHPRTPNEVRKTLTEVQAEDQRAEADGKPGIRLVTERPVIVHHPVATEWELPTGETKV